MRAAVLVALAFLVIHEHFSILPESSTLNVKVALSAQETVGLLDLEGPADGDPKGAMEGAEDLEGLAEGDPKGAIDGAGLEVTTHVPHESGHFAL